VKIALLISCAILAGCATTQPVQQQASSELSVPNLPTLSEMQQQEVDARNARAKVYAIKHPDASNRLLKDFVDGKIEVGMTYEQAQVVMGSPRRKIQSGGVGGTAETWVYGESDYAYLFFSDGLLTRWQFQ
jgi:hypothetical protein